MKLLPGTTRARVVFIASLAFMVTGSLFIGGLAQPADGNGIVVSLFLVFLGAIIAMQVVPGALLFGAMIKGLCALTRKATAKDTDK